MKKFICVTLLLALAAVLVGCGKKTGKSDNTTDTTAQTSTAVAEIPDETSEELTTARKRNITSNNNFEYEIYNENVIITKYTGGLTEVTIPDTVEGFPVKEIGFYAFEAQPITSVAIPESVAVIGEGAFIDCASLGSIRLPSALKTIEMGAFAGCSALTEMTIPAGVKEIKRGAFAGCGSMKSLVIESSELGYGEWGIEDLPDLTVYAAEGSAASEWAGNMGKYSVIEEK